MRPIITQYCSMVMQAQHDIVVLVVVMMLLLSPTSAVYGSKDYHRSANMNKANKYDVIVFAATPAGFAAALAAKVSGAESVLLLEPTTHVGGMASPGGIGLRDCNNNEVRINNSTQYTWAMRNAAFYGVDEPVWQPDNWVGEQSFLVMIEEYGVELRLNTTFVEGSDGVRTTLDSSTGLRRISAIQLESGEWLECLYFIDASYECEVMIATEVVSWTYGREAQSDFDESFGGISPGSVGQFRHIVNPYTNEPAGDLSVLKYIQEGPDPREHVGEADTNLMSYTFRLCLTANQSNMVPFTKPPRYNPADFELARRYLLSELEAGDIPHLPWSNLAYHGYPSYKSMKYDACCGSSSVGIDAIGLAVGYPTATRAQRKEIYDRHKYYVQGLVWFWTNDSSVPEHIRYSNNLIGLCKDEWPDNNHFPPQLYVREAARVVGDKVYSQNDRVDANYAKGCKDDSIAIGSWGFDIHDMQRVVVTEQRTQKKKVYNEGLTRFNNGGIVFFEIPYYVLLPQRKQMVNLAIPNCPSVTHVAFSAIREEPTLWQMGQAAGTAAGIGVKLGGTVALQDIDPHHIQRALLEQDTFVHWPPDKDSCVRDNGDGDHLPDFL